MDVSGIGAIGGGVSVPVPRQATPATGVDDEAPGFGEMIRNGVGAVGDAEHHADSLAQRFAVGDAGVDVQDVTIAAAEASVSVQLMVAVRDRALEAYQQIMNLQV